MIAPVMLAAAAAISVHDNLVRAGFEAGDLHVVAGIDRSAMRGDSPIQKLGVERFADDKVEPLYTGRQRLDGLGKFAGDKADQGQFGVFLQRLVRRAGRLWLGLAAIGGVSREF